MTQLCDVWKSWWLKRNYDKNVFRSEGNCETFGWAPNRQTLATSCHKHQEKIARYATIYSGQFLKGFHWIKWPLLFPFNLECLSVFSILHNELLIRTRPSTSISEILLSDCWPVTPLWFPLWATIMYPLALKKNNNVLDGLGLNCKLDFCLSVWSFKTSGHHTPLMCERWAYSKLCVKIVLNLDSRTHLELHLSNRFFHMLTGCPGAC